MSPQSSSDSVWLESVVSLSDDAEADTVSRFMDRLIRLAQTRLPPRLNRRVDAEDIVQSVFSSFFHRHRNQQFDIGDSVDLWRLLAAMTYRKTLKAIQYHGRNRRDFTRESDSPADLPNASPALSDDPTASALLVMAELLDQILAQLPEEHQQILQLRLENYSIDEIADRAEVSTRTVNRALKSVRQIAAELAGQGE